MTMLKLCNSKQTVFRAAGWVLEMLYLFSLYWLLSFRQDCLRIALENHRSRAFPKHWHCMASSGSWAKSFISCFFFNCSFFLWNRKCFWFWEGALETQHSWFFLPTPVFNISRSTTTTPKVRAEAVTSWRAENQPPSLFSYFFLFSAAVFLVLEKRLWFLWY